MLRCVIVYVNSIFILSVVLFLQVQLISGELICPETGVKFPVSNGIPNMLANEDEV